MKSSRATYNLAAVSALAREVAINTEQSLDTSLMLDLSDIAQLEPRRENNADEANGLEEPDTIYDLGNTAAMSMNFNKAQPQHFAFVMSYGLGAVTTAAAGAGYEHTITPIDGDLAVNCSNPSFTLAQRLGKTILKRLFATMVVDSFAATFAKGDWVKLAASLKGTGKYTDSIVEETVNAQKDAVTLNLAANGVEGSTAPERLGNIHQIKVELAPGQWTEVAFSAVSAATPAVITITAPGATTDLVNYKILYAPTETAAWMTFPARVVESAMRVAQMNLVVGGAWTGAAFVGGRAINSDLNQIEYNCNNSMQIEFVPGAGDAYASSAIRDGRAQAISLSREFRDFILQNYIKTNDYFGLHLICQGAEFDAGHNYQVELIFPKLGILKAPLSVNGKRLAEAGDLTVLEDATYGSVIVKVKNLVATYAA